SLAEEMDATLARELAAARIPDDMLSYVAAGDATWEAGRAAYDYGRQHEGDFRIPVAEAELLAPLQPEVLICGRANFYDHLDETKRGKPDEVEFFLKSTSAIIGPGHPVYYDPKLSKKYDYEVELGIIIGEAGRNIPV